MTKKNVSLFLIFLSLIIVINNSLRFYRNKTAYEMGDWLINYQGGFVRKGLIGEFFFQIHKFADLNPALLILFFIIFLYLSYYFVIAKFLKKIVFDKILLFVLFSPIAFFFPVFNSKASARKEILFFSALSLLCYFLPKIDKKYFFYIYASLFIILGLSYEGFVFYYIYLIIPYLFIVQPQKISEIKFFLLGSFFIVSLVIFLTFNFHGSSNHVEAICNSIKDFANPQCTTFGQIAFLKHDISIYLGEKFNTKINYLEPNSIFPNFITKYITVYFIFFLVCFAPIFFLYRRSSCIILIFNKKINFILFLIIPLVTTIPIYVVGMDWGRYLHISYLSSLIIFLFLINNNLITYKHKEEYYKNNLTFKKMFFIVFFVLFCFGWSVPFCCKTEIKSGLFRSIKIGISHL